MSAIQSVYHELLIDRTARHLELFRSYRVEYLSESRRLQSQPIPPEVKAALINIASAFENVCILIGRLEILLGELEEKEAQ